MAFIIYSSADLEAWKKDMQKTASCPLCKQKGKTPVKHRQTNEIHALPTRKTDNEKPLESFFLIWGFFLIFTRTNSLNSLNKSKNGKTPHLPHGPTLAKPTRENSR
ncbi:hypothetical protein X474_03120 [Dethiosulfatarculus sandiegensis]|uniref:Uncharacterized protein n=1 Tax=Dethiosulfatarculus sandiegensis TaxID=1429043 RepID=A0A0D2JJA8_9BACT|nr:hypothetical protein X474_03120 [Dethiosulfatarculus sandiegensis]